MDFFPKCKFCGERHRNGPEFCSALGNTKRVSGTARKAPSGSSSGGPSRNAPQVRTAEVKPPVIAAAETDQGEAEHSSHPRHLKPTDLLLPGKYEVTGVAKKKKGRPRLGEKSDEPWKALGMSERTYYRRQAEKAGK